MSRNLDRRKKQSAKVAQEIMERVRFVVGSRNLDGKKIVERGGELVELSLTSYIEGAIKKQLDIDLHKDNDLTK